MPSADFCVLTRHVSMKGAIEKIMSRCMLCVSHRDSYPSTATEYAWSLSNRIDLSGIALMNLLSHDAQISPDKNVNFLCTNAAFTLSPEPVGFAMCGWLARRLSLICGFCPSARTFAIGLPSDPSSRRRPCLRLVLLVVSTTMNTLRFSYRGLSPHKFTPMSGVPQYSATTSCGYPYSFRKDLKNKWGMHLTQVTTTCSMFARETHL